MHFEFNRRKSVLVFTINDTQMVLYFIKFIWFVHTRGLRKKLELLNHSGGFLVYFVWMCVCMDGAVSCCQCLYDFTNETKKTTFFRDIVLVLLLLLFCSSIVSFVFSPIHSLPLPSSVLLVFICMRFSWFPAANAKVSSPCYAFCALIFSTSSCYLFVVLSPFLLIPSSSFVEPESDGILSFL